VTPSTLQSHLLRSMKKAIYSEAHEIHYGLASPAYTHFTSPIRRYPDLVVHRILRAALRGEAPPKTAELAKIADHSSYRERLATDAERESIKIKQVRYAHTHLGDEYEAQIVGMTEKGLFVQIRSPFIEGLVSVEAMGMDFFAFNEERMVFAGRKTRRTFSVGDSLHVRVARADLDRLEIDFTLVDTRVVDSPAQA